MNNPTITSLFNKIKEFAGNKLKNIVPKVFAPETIEAQYHVEPSRPTYNPNQSTITPVAPVSATPTPYDQTIQIPDENGGTYTIPSHDPNHVDAENINNAFGNLGLNKEFAQVMRHPNQQTYTPEEIARIGKESWNRGENPDLSYGLMEAPNPNGTKDYGAGRTNSSVFDDMKRHAFWGKKMAENGINTYQDLADPDKALRMSRLQVIRDNYANYQASMNPDGSVTKWKSPPSFKIYYAAPVSLK